MRDVVTCLCLLACFQWLGCHLQEVKRAKIWCHWACVLKSVKKLNRSLCAVVSQIVSETHFQALRVVFNWVSREIHVCFCFTSLCDCLRRSRTFINQWEAKLKLIRTDFPALGAGYTSLFHFLSRGARLAKEIVQFCFGYTTLYWKPLYISYFNNVWRNVGLWLRLVSCCR